MTFGLRQPRTAGAGSAPQQHRPDEAKSSIASFIIALGLLVDDSVVAGDAIERELLAPVR